MKNNRRNLIFLLLIAITFSSTLGIFLNFNKTIQTGSPFLELMIVDGILLLGVTILMLSDIVNRKEEKHDEENLKKINKERKINKVLIQQKMIDEKDVGKNLMHTHYAFENYRNTIRTLFIFITHCFIFSSLFVFYHKLNVNSGSFITAVVFGTLSLFVHFGFLGYSLYMQKYHKEYRSTMEIVRDKNFKR